MDHQRPPPPFSSRSSLFNTANQPARQYGSEQQSRQDGRAHPPYSGLHHLETDPPRTTTTTTTTSSSFGYGTPSFASDMRPRSRPLSPMRFGSMRSDASSPVKQNGAAAKESSGGLYHDGRTFSFFLLFFFTSDLAPVPCPNHSAHFEAICTEHIIPSFSFILHAPSMTFYRCCGIGHALSTQRGASVKEGVHAIPRHTRVTWLFADKDQAVSAILPKAELARLRVLSWPAELFVG